MRIGIEAQRIFRPHKFGMDIAAIELIRQLQKLDLKNEYVIFIKPDKDACIEETDNFKIHFIKKAIYPVWEQIHLPKAVKKTKVDLLHCTSNTAPLKLGVPLVLTLHDIISLEPRARYWMSLYQEMGRIYRKLIIPRVVPKCARLITVSGVEKQLISRMMPKVQNRISVIHNGVDGRFRPVDEIGQKKIREKYQLPDRYMSFIGNTDPRKNVHNVLHAYSIYLNHSKEKLPLVVLHLNEKRLMQLLKLLKIKNILPHIKILDYLDADDMPGFYAASEMFLFPSLREGFGMPILEAVACGTPVITSDVSSMPEVAGDAALLVDPFNADEIALNILYMEEHSEHAEELREKGLKRSREFSWKKMTGKVLEIYKELEQ